MIVVDSSALVAILENEPEAQRFANALRETPRCVVSAVTVYENRDRYLHATGPRASRARNELHR